MQSSEIWKKNCRDSFSVFIKGYLVNLACIDEYNKTEVTLVNGDKLLISKYKYPDFIKAYLRYMQ